MFFKNKSIGALQAIESFLYGRNVLFLLNINTSGAPLNKLFKTEQLDESFENRSSDGFIVSVFAYSVIDEYDSIFGFLIPKTTL